MRKTKEQAEQTRQKILNAARKMFFQNGVAKTSLEHIAKEAGVTRGAIYWHFKDKTALFFALQQSACVPIDEGMQKIFKNPQYQNPLDAIEAALQFFFSTIQTRQSAKEMFSIMALKCEYVMDFENVIDHLMQPARHFLKTLEFFYQQAAVQNLLKKDSNPNFFALDTMIFVNGLTNYLASNENAYWQTNVEKLIKMHMQLRRNV